MNVDHRHGIRQSNWSVELCNCEHDPTTCFITCFLPCITFGETAEVLDGGLTSCMTHGCRYGCLMITGFHWLYSCVYREKLRTKYGLPAYPCSDCCVHLCCEPCALCQENAELKARSFQPSKGWIGPPVVSPPMPASMNK